MSYLKNFISSNVDGRKLLTLDDDALRHIGVTKDNARLKIIRGISLLYYYVSFIYYV